MSVQMSALISRTGLLISQPAYIFAVNNLLITMKCTENAELKPGGNILNIVAKFRKVSIEIAFKNIHIMPESRLNCKI